MPDLYPDRDLDNADWTKTSWDLDATDVPSLRAYLKAKGLSVAHFKTLPVYRQNIDRLPWLKKL